MIEAQIHQWKGVHQKRVEDISIYFLKLIIIVTIILSLDIRYLEYPLPRTFIILKFFFGPFSTLG